MSVGLSWLLMAGVLALAWWVGWELRRNDERKARLHRDRLREAADRQLLRDREWMT